MKEIINIGAVIIVELFVALIFVLGYFFFKGVSIVNKENKIPKDKSGK